VHVVPPARHVLVCLTAAFALLGGCTSTVDGTGSPLSASPGGPSNPAPNSGPVSPGNGPSDAPESSDPPVPAEPAAQFHDCSSAFNLDALTFPAGRRDKLTFECALISVPLDYADPTGSKISIVLIKVHDSDNTNSIGSLLVNPGGPGGSGIDAAVGLSAQLPDEIMTHFDIIGFDPRGVGQSSPIQCLTDAEKDQLNAESPDVLTAAGFAKARATAKSIADKCAQKYGSSLADYNTVSTAKDMDLIRQAVGDSKMNYLGFSYGTELGSVYAHLFPQNIRVAVLDGAVDPLTSDLATDTNQLQGFEGAFDQFAAYCRKTDPCSQLGDPRAAVQSIVHTAAQSPIPSSTPGETRQATPAIVDTGVLSALYSRSQWPTLGQALIDAEHGDSSKIFQLADQYNERYNGHYTNIADANETINCNDAKPGPSNSTIRATAKEWAKRFPLFGLWNAPSLFSCQQWQPDRTVPPLPTAPTPNKVLVIGNLHDPATPYQGAQDLAKTMGNAELVTWDGEGHTSYLQGSSCVDGYVNNYLVNITLPPTGKTCPP
jgi:pimeloyl-ACP methyl ester carboxylesterase